MKYFWQFLGLDLFTKLLAVMIAPENSVFYLKYNPGMMMGIETNWFMKFALPLMCFPLPYLLSKFSNGKVPQWTLGLIYAGVVGNYIGRFSDQGVVDFIHCRVFICNLADIYLWIGVGFMYKVFLLDSRKTT